MKTVDLPVGSHVVFNGGSNNYPQFYEAYVIAHRPKGNKYSSWGGKTGNADTIGIAYARPYLRAKNGSQIWDFGWVRPASLVEPWADYQVNQKIIIDRDSRIKADRAKALRVRKAQAAQIPPSIRSLFSDYEWDRLIERGETSTFTFSIARLQRIIEAAQAEVPATKAARIQAEVDAALALL